MRAYERLTYRDATRRRTIYLVDPRDIPFLGSPAVTGIEVDRQGDEVLPHNADERRRVIAKSLITRRTPVTIDRKYGILRSAGEQL